MAKTNATQRSLKLLRENGWTCHIVEKYIKHPNMAFGKRIDAFGIGDILACRSPVYSETWRCPQCQGKKEITVDRRKIWCKDCNHTGKMLLGDAAIALVQCFPDSTFAAHRTKILVIPELAIWKAAGGKVFLQGWALKGQRGKKKRWTVREQEL